MTRKFRAVRKLGWQLDYRPDGWLPLGVREGTTPGWHVLELGRLGCITLGRVRPPREVVLELTLDASRFMNSMEAAAYESNERGREDAYRRRIARERLLAKANVGAQLDDMCRAYGWDPVQVWRLPREREEQREQDRVDAMAYAIRAYYGLAVLRPIDPFKIIGGNA